MGVWKRLQRISKDAYRFEFTFQLHEIMVECDPKWQPTKLMLVFSRKGRRLQSSVVSWQPSLQNPLVGSALFGKDERVQLEATLYRDAHRVSDASLGFDTKHWIVELEECSERTRLLAGCQLDMAEFTHTYQPTIDSDSGETTAPKGQLAVARLRVQYRFARLARIAFTVSCRFIRSGSAADDDMQSEASFMSDMDDVGRIDDVDDDCQSDLARPRASSFLSRRFNSVRRTLPWKAHADSNDAPGTVKKNPTQFMSMRRLGTKRPALPKGDAFGSAERVDASRPRAKSGDNLLLVNEARTPGAADAPAGQQSPQLSDLLKPLDDIIRKSSITGLDDRSGSSPRPIYTGTPPDSPVIPSSPAARPLTPPAEIDIDKFLAAQQTPAGAAGTHTASVGANARCSPPHLSIQGAAAVTPATTPFGSSGTPKLPSISPDELLIWCQQCTQSYDGVRITNFSTSWRNGLAFCALIHHFRPDLIGDFARLSPRDIEANNKLAFDTAASLGIPKTIDARAMSQVIVPDKLTVITYLFQMRCHFTGQQMEFHSGTPGLYSTSQSAMFVFPGDDDSASRRPPQQRVSQMDVASRTPLALGRLDEQAEEPPAEPAAPTAVASATGAHRASHAPALVAPSSLPLPPPALNASPNLPAITPPQPAPPVAKHSLNVDHTKDTKPVSPTKPGRSKTRDSAKSEKRKEPNQQAVPVSVMAAISAKDLRDPLGSDESDEERRATASAEAQPADPKPPQAAHTPVARRAPADASAAATPNHPAAADTSPIRIVDYIPDSYDLHHSRSPFKTRHVGVVTSLTRAASAAGSLPKERQQELQERARALLQQAKVIPPSGPKSAAPMGDAHGASPPGGTTLSPPGQGPSNAAAPSPQSSSATNDADRAIPSVIGSPAPSLIRKLTLSKPNISLSKPPPNATPADGVKSHPAELASAADDRPIAVAQPLFGTTAAAQIVPAASDPLNASGQSALNAKPADTTIEHRKNPFLHDALRADEAETFDTLNRAVESASSTRMANKDESSAKRLSGVERGGGSVLLGGAEAAGRSGAERGSGGEEARAGGTASGGASARVRPLSGGSNGVAARGRDSSPPSTFFQAEMCAVELEQRRIDTEAGVLERQLRFAMQQKDAANKALEEQLLSQWFDLVTKKNALLHRVEQLQIAEQETDLVKRHAHLQNELQLLAQVPDQQKTDDQRHKEQLLLGELMDIVRQRDQLVREMDSQQQQIEQEQQIEQDTRRNIASIGDSKQCAVQ